MCTQERLTRRKNLHRNGTYRSYQTGNILEKSNLKCCQSFLNGFGDFGDPRNQIDQVPPEIPNFRWIQRWAKRGTGHEKMKIFQCRNQWYQSIGHHKRMKKYKNTYGKTSSLPKLSALNPIMHEVFKVAFGHWGANLPQPLPQSSMTRTEELKLCRNSNYYGNYYTVKMVPFLLTSAIFFSCRQKSYSASS